jgi:hypothetical protein
MRHNVLCFFKELGEPSFSACARVRLLDSGFKLSKTGSYCFITGRVRFSFTLTSSSRHLFFDLMSDGLNTGFFMAS